MTSSELHRRLLFCGYTDLSFYLKDSQVNRYIYNQLLVFLSEHELDVSILTLFNEVYYQMVRIHRDGEPGVDIAVRYLEEERAWLRSQPASEMVFCLVWVFLNRMQVTEFSASCFKEQLFPLIKKNNFFLFAQSLIRNLEKEKLCTQNYYGTHPCRVTEIPMRIDLEYQTSMSLINKIRLRLSLPVESSAKDFNPWRKVTNNFSEKTIERYIRLYVTREDQLGLLDRIEKACTKAEHREHQRFFLQLKANICEGDYVPQSVVYYHYSGEKMPDTNFLKQKEQWVQEKAQYKNQIKLLEKRLTEMRNEKEVEKSLLQAKYEVAIEELRQSISGQKGGEDDVTIAPEKKKTSVEQGGEEISLTIEELIAEIKKTLSHTSANEISLVLYHILINRGIKNDEAFKLIDSITPAIYQREALHQTINIPSANHVEINPQIVNTFNNSQK